MLCIVSLFYLHYSRIFTTYTLSYTPQDLIRAKLIESDLKLPNNLIDDPSIKTTNYLANIHDLDSFYRRNLSIQKSHISSKGHNSEAFNYEGKEDEERFSVSYTAYDKEGDSFTGHNSEGDEEEEEEDYYDDTFETENKNNNDDEYSKEGHNSDPYDTKLDNDGTFIVSTEVSRQKSHTNLLIKSPSSPAFQLVKPPTNTKPNNNTNSSNNTNKNSKQVSQYSSSTSTTTTITNTGVKSPHIIEKKGIRGDRVRGKQPPTSSAVVRIMICFDICYYVSAAY